MSQLTLGLNIIPVGPATLGSLGAVAKDISAAGYVVGEYLLGATTDEGIYYGFIWDTTKPDFKGLITGIGYDTVNDPANLNGTGTYAGTRLSDVNDVGTVVGRIDYKIGTSRYSYSFQTSLGRLMSTNPTVDVLQESNASLAASMPGATNLHAQGLNNQNQIVGIYKNKAKLTRGFLYTPPLPIRIRVDPGFHAGPWDGTFESIEPIGEALLDKVLQEDYAPAEVTIQIFDINDSGEMCGTCATKDPKGNLVNRAFWWDRDRNPHQLLFDSISPSTTIGIAYGINNQHTIVGGAVDTSVPADMPINGPTVGWIIQTYTNPPAAPTASLPAEFRASFEVQAGTQYPPNIQVSPQWTVGTQGPSRYVTKLSGDTSILGISGDGWYLGRTTFEPAGPNYSSGSEAFVYVPKIVREPVGGP